MDGGTAGNFQNNEEVLLYNDCEFSLDVEDAKYYFRDG